MERNVSETFIMGNEWVKTGGKLQQCHIKKKEEYDLNLISKQWM